MMDDMNANAIAIVQLRRVDERFPKVSSQLVHSGQSVVSAGIEALR